jgi:hypothetical protein
LQQEQASDELMYYLVITSQVSAKLKYPEQSLCEILPSSVTVLFLQLYPKLRKSKHILVGNGKAIPVTYRGGP